MESKMLCLNVFRHIGCFCCAFLFVQICFWPLTLFLCRQAAINNSCFLSLNPTLTALSLGHRPYHYPQKEQKCLRSRVFAFCQLSLGTAGLPLKAQLREKKSLQLTVLCDCSLSGRGEAELTSTTQPTPSVSFSVQFYLYHVLYNTILSRCFTGAEKLPFNRKKPWAGPGLQAGTILLKE